MTLHATHAYLAQQAERFGFDQTLDNVDVQLLLPRAWQLALGKTRPCKGAGPLTLVLHVHDKPPVLAVRLTPATNIFCTLTITHAPSGQAIYPAHPLRPASAWEAPATADAIALLEAARDDLLALPEMDWTAACPSKVTELSREDAIKRVDEVFARYTKRAKKIERAAAATWRAELKGLAEKLPKTYRAAWIRAHVQARHPWVGQS